MSLRKKFVNSSLANKTCVKCNDTYPRTEEYFYRVSHRTRKGCFNYDSYCITCRLKIGKEAKKKNKAKKVAYDLKYLQTERGYFISLFNSVKRSVKGNLFKDFDEFMSCWRKQQEKYGEYCPYYPHIKMTRIKGKKKPTDTNISVDRLVNTLPYDKNNIMFISWKANNEKGDVSYYLARKMIDYIEEKEQLRMFVDMDTFSRNDKKFNFKEYWKMRRKVDNEVE
jgi:hypothetical protein